jgi:hypothetical protein
VWTKFANFTITEPPILTVSLINQTIDCFQEILVDLNVNAVGGNPHLLMHKWFGLQFGLDKWIYKFATKQLPLLRGVYNLI